MKILRAEWKRQARVYRDLLRDVLCDSNQGTRDNHRLREFFNIVERNTEFLWRLTLEKVSASLPKRQPVARGNTQSVVGDSAAASEISVDRLTTPDVKGCFPGTDVEGCFPGADATDAAAAASQ
ncbi:hypothetical protein HPB47_015891 [Ixodes persulcatus]|uniref:Uncharacterized protein n=1 Tax=Ixodes persulcatus TaxID=34615 RepID=A0AC60QUW6_IXOPE|nr:hypothetical protein HPB47_015891 [Ixodes persulcatus]